MLETRAALLTAIGRGAVAVIRVWGPDGLATADRAFQPMRGKSLATTPPSRLRFGRMGAGVGDEVVAVALTQANGSTEVEIQCHGGPVAAQLVLDALIEAGAKLASAADWIGRGIVSKSIADAWLDLARATTLKTAQILLDQANGALDRSLQNLQTEDDIQTLLDRATVGLKLVEGWRVALAGRPNVGKSRLMNALAGYGRAIVDPTPGTTRDVVTVRIALDGWPIALADTAGLRDSPDPIEASGVARARLEQSRADLILVVLDLSEPLHEGDHALMRDYPAAIRVANKCDLPTAWDTSLYDAVAISAERGDHLDLLMTRIVERLIPELPPPGAAVPFRADQVTLLTSLRLDRGEDV